MVAGGPSDFLPRSGRRRNGEKTNKRRAGPHLGSTCAPPRPEIPIISASSCRRPTDIYESCARARVQALRAGRDARQTPDRVAARLFGSDHLSWESGSCSTVGFGVCVLYCNLFILKLLLECWIVLFGIIIGSCSRYRKINYSSLRGLKTMVTYSAK